MPFAPYLYYWRNEDHDDNGNSNNFNKPQLLRGSFFLSRDLEQQQQQQHHHDEELQPWTVILCALLVLLLCWCSKPNIPDARFRRPRSYWTTARDRKIQRSLHIRQVVAVDATSGNLQLGPVAAATPSASAVQRQTDNDDDGIEESVDSTTTLSSHNDATADRNSSNSNNNNPTSNNVREELVVIVLPDAEDMDDDDDDTAAGCSICLEPYRVGDVVAWTALPPQEDDTACLHVFHHACILEWLANPQKNDCPTCRAKILWDHDVHDDDDEDDDKGDGNAENEGNHDDSVNSSAFCVMHGLIARARRASYCKFMGSSDAMVRDAAEVATALSLRSSQIPLSEPSPLRRAHTVCATGRNGNVLLFQQQEQRASLLRRRRRRLEWCWTEPTSLRRVASAGPSTPVRSNTSCSTYNNKNSNNNSISSGIYQRTVSRTFGVTAATTDDDDDDDCAGLDLPMLSSSSSTGAPSNYHLPQSISLSRSASLGCQQPSATGDSVRLLRRNTTTSLMMMNASSNSVRNPPFVGEPITNTDGVFRNLVRMRHSLSWGSRNTINVGDDDDGVDRTDEDDIFLYRTTTR